MNLGPHAAFILLSYGAAILILAVLIAWIWLSHRALKRTLAALEERGVTRRSDERRKYR